MGFQLALPTIMVLTDGKERENVGILRLTSISIPNRHPRPEERTTGGSLHQLAPEGQA